MISDPKYFCEKCNAEVGISDHKCDSCDAYPLYFSCKYFVKVTYSSAYYFFNRVSEQVALPEKSFTSMEEKEAWFVNTIAALRLKHFAEAIPCQEKRNKTTKMRTYFAIVMVNVVKSLMSKK